MELRIIKNDSYREICKIVKISESNLSDYIVNKLQETGVIGDYSKESGKTLNDVLKIYNEYSIKEVCYILFKEYINVSDLIEFLPHLEFWTKIEKSMNDQCESCGCEMYILNDSIQVCDNENCSSQYLI